LLFVSACCVRRPACRHVLVLLVAFSFVLLVFSLVLHVFSFLRVLCAC
jgi:hypothetical protein